jgi:L-ornithine N5-monooxygenase
MSGMRRDGFGMVGIGFGPSGIGLCAAIADWAEVDGDIPFGPVRFLEKQDNSAWHGKFLLRGTDLNSHFLRDFVTPRNPRSRFSFANYLSEHGRLFDFCLLGRPVSRIEWNDYVSWVTSALAEYVAYKEPVSWVRPIVEAKRIVALEVRTESNVYRTRRVVLAMGATPHIPECFRGLLGERVFHTSEFLPKIKALEPNQPLRFAVIGSGQSAGEAVIEIYERFENAKIFSIHRKIGFRLYDLGHFTNLVFSPDEADYFYKLPHRAKHDALRDVRATNYAGLDFEGSSKLYSLMYEDRVVGQERIFMLNRREVTYIIDDNGAFKIRLADIYTGTPSEIEVDVIVLATGYREEAFPSILEPLRGHVAVDEDGGLVVNRDHSLSFLNAASAEIYLSGLCERTHGIGEGQTLSTCAIRADRILRAMLRSTQAVVPMREVRDVPVAS